MQINKVSRRYLIGFITAMSAFHYSKRAAFAIDINKLNPKIKSLAGIAKIADGDFSFLLPDVAESGYSVELSVSGGDNGNDGIAALSILAPENPESRILNVEFGSMATGKFSTRIRLARSQTVYGLVRTRSGKIVSGEKPVSVIVGGCGNDLPVQE